MAYKCEIMADSIGPNGDRLTTFKLTYSRIIHAEMLRHRMLSRNVASSRAIPFEKMVKDVQEDPFIPIAWQKDHKGMQGTKYFTGWRAKVIELAWRSSAKVAVWGAKKLNKLGVTKQLCNRILEPFVWTTELVSGTEWKNFFDLRCPKYYGKYKSWKDACNQGGVTENTSFEYRMNESQAETHIQKIAEMMWDCMNESVPKELKSGEWHIPYREDLDMTKVMSTSEWLLNETPLQDSETIKLLPLKIATARAARLSYTTLGDNPKIDYEADIKLHDRLLESKHLSCFEHCARVMTENEYGNMFQKTVPQKDHRDYFVDHIPGWCNNFRGFIQYRHLIEK